MHQRRCQQLSEASEVHSASLYYFFVANYFLRWGGGGRGKQERARAAVERVCWQGTAKALDPALAHAKQQEGCEMGPDCFCFDKSSQHRHKRVFIELVQSVLQSSRHGKCCMQELENTQDEHCAGCKGKV